MGSFLFLPSVEPGNGTGHLVRALGTASELASISEKNETALYLPREYLRPGIEGILGKFPGLADHLLTDEAAMEGRHWDFTVWDRRATGKEEFARWKDLGVPLGLDEGGRVRNRFPLLIDTFPLPRRFGAANLSEAGFLPQPDRKRDFPAVFGKILISFGGEDPAGLTEKTLRFLIERADRPPQSITLVLGPLFGERELPGGIQILRNPENLAERMHLYDLVCTSFGLTAYEAVSAGTGVLLINPSAYHTELSRQAGFPVVGTGEIDASLFLRLLENPGEVIRAAREVRPREGLRLSGYLSKLQVPEVKNCPFCGNGEGVCLSRFEGRTFFRCDECGLVYQQNFHPEVGNYGEDYFFSEYRRHYGKTYLEDFDTLMALARPRIRRLEQVGVSSGKLLDVGCAYGPFLLEARRRGYDVSGLDVVPEATDYVKRELGIPAACLPFQDYDPGVGGFDVLTMWYVIEHFADLGKVLDRVHRLLRPGGIFAFSTPNLEGVTGRGRHVNFLEKSPEDHHTVWSPEIAGKVLGRAGFSIERIVSTGHHPERFGIYRKKTTGGGSPGGARGLDGFRGAPGYSILLAYSRLMKLGDTFEVYARKTGGFDAQ